MVLHDGRDDDVGGREAQAVGEVVDRFGGVAADDRDVVAAGAAGKAADLFAGALVGGRGQLGLVAGAAVDAGVPGQELSRRARRPPKGHW